MKLPFTIYDLRFTIWKKSANPAVVVHRTCAAGNRKSSIVNRKSEQGIALVITLILLSVTLVMALAFLAVSTRENGAITTSTETATARNAADSALAHAEAQIVANILSTKNPYNYGLLVSTNYIPVSSGNSLQDLTNLIVSPRAPALISAGEPAGRFYLDLNRNGSFDANGYVTNVDNLNNPIFDSSGNPLLPEVGDPEWIGVLERPDANYGPNNKFLSRYAFICLPAGNTYDLNYIYNQAYTATLDPANDGYIRNQGAGGWEINLPALFADLNTDIWSPNPLPDSGYYALGRPASRNQGIAFDDAFSLLSYRYANNYSSLATPQNLFGLANATTAFQNDIDVYSAGQPLMANTTGITESYPVNIPWAGADNTNHFFDLSSDLFNPAKSSPQFTNRLGNAGVGASTYDRYTFYRLLEQLGTDSTPEQNKINLNYSNAIAYFDNNGMVTNISVIPGAETNFVPWQPIQFFTIAADRMLRLYTANWLDADPTNFVKTFNVTVPFGITNIPVLVSNQFVYSPAVQRVLQLAANIYDATTTNFYPSVFRPLFTQTNGDIFVTGYTNIESVTGTGDPAFSVPLEASVNAGIVGVNAPVNVYGVPWIIGAKKGFPNFNKYSMETSVQITRKLQVKRDPSTLLPTSTNQMYVMSISNFLGADCWNSYNSSYPKTGTASVQIAVLDNFTMQLTNDDPNFSPIFISPTYFNTPNPFSVPIWPPSSDPNSFLAPLNTNAILLADSVYNYGPNPAPGFPSPPGFVPESALTDPDNYLNTGTPALRQFYLQMTNRLRLVILDSTNVIDYVQLNGMDASTNLSAALADPDDSSGTGGFWSPETQASTGVPMGVVEQMNISSGARNKNNIPVIPDADAADGGNWNQVPGQPGLNGNDHLGEQTYFSAFLLGQSNFKFNKKTYFITATNTQVPYTPTRTRVLRFTWQANDPLVHYLTSDLTDKIYDAEIQNVIDWPWNLRTLNERYMPWGGNPNTGVNSANPDNFNVKTASQRTLKDPLIYSSDNWDFPTNKFPTVGWLGRVHRGTPWQTVYLKAFGVDTNDWSTWTGDLNMYDATNMVPDRDRLLFDLFTTAPNDNATRGQLSVNQTHFPAWSALFSGMVVATNQGGYTVINPGGVNGTGSAVFQLFTNIEDMRSTYTNTASTGGAFKHIGDILSAATLTEQSPFLNLSDTNNLNDELYEWLPQQMMSLLRVSTVPRYVIYSYGQTLTPAGPNAIATGGAFSGMITNYQVVAETVTRTVVRIEGAPTNTHAVIESFNILPPN